jgi:cell division protein FtsI/penicillin-binding protein 2
MEQKQTTAQFSANQRISFFYACIMIVAGIFILRLFYLQVIRHSYYQEQAQASQLKRYEIAAERGAIYAQDGAETAPLVLNERRYNIIADPEIIIDKEKTAEEVAAIVKGDKQAIQKQLENVSRYEILASKQTKEVKAAIENAYEKGEIEGVFTERTNLRIYPQGSLAANVLGFVDDEGVGRYGLEEALQAELGGTPGRVKALTDRNGIPLLATGENIVEDPISGTDTVLTIDLNMQRQVEQLLEAGLEAARSESGDIIVLDPSSGAIKAMASYPTYDPAKFYEIEDTRLFNNSTVSAPLEPGSVMKALTAAAALDSGSVGRDQTYYDPSFYSIDGATVRNIEEDGGAAVRSISDILRFSLNTGATWLLMQMGNGELNQQGRERWHSYMTEHYRFGTATGVEQGFEETGFVPDPNDGFGLNIRYANTSFGQGMTVTPLQMAAAVASVVNGGTYYQPTLVAGYGVGERFQANEPKILKESVVSKEVSDTIVEFMQTVVAGNSVTRNAQREGYIVGGKTGTAEIARPEGGYYDDRFNGTYVGFVGGDSPEYLVFVRVDDPGIGGYAGSQAAAPMFVSVVDLLVNNFSVRGGSAN